MTRSPPATSTTALVRRSRSAAVRVGDSPVVPATTSVSVPLASRWPARRWAPSRSSPPSGRNGVAMAVSTRPKRPGMWLPPPRVTDRAPPACRPGRLGGGILLGPPVRAAHPPQGAAQRPGLSVGSGVLGRGAGAVVVVVVGPGSAVVVVATGAVVGVSTPPGVSPRWPVRVPVPPPVAPVVPAARIGRATRATVPTLVLVVAEVPGRLAEVTGSVAPE